jgi:hypothetical protein
MDQLERLAIAVQLCIAIIRGDRLARDLLLANLGERIRRGEAPSFERVFAALTRRATEGNSAPPERRKALTAMVFLAIADWSGCSGDELEQAVEAGLRSPPPPPEA